MGAVFEYFKSCQKVEDVDLFLLILKNKTSPYRENKEALSKCPLLSLLLEVVIPHLWKYSNRHVQVF